MAAEEMAAEPEPEASEPPEEVPPAEPEPVRPVPVLPATVAIPDTPAWKPSPVPRPKAEPEPPKPRTVRWLPVAAIVLLAGLVAAAIAVAAGGGQNAAPASEPPPSTARSAHPKPVESLQFAPVATAADQRCASHAFGDAQASLQHTSCSGVRRASYRAVVDGRDAAVTIGIVEFPDAGQANGFKAVVDTPGGGGVLDLAQETGQWGGAAPRFENAAYASKLDGKSVRVVQAVWLPGPSTPDDPGLVRAAKSALDLPA
jgi:hypothetical protein